MFGMVGNVNVIVFNCVNIMKWLMYIVQEKGWLRVYFFIFFECKLEYKKRFFFIEEELQRIIYVDLKYKCQCVMWDMFFFMCFIGFVYVDFRVIIYDNIYIDFDGGIWLMGNCIKIGVVYVVKLLFIVIEFIEKYRGVDEKKDFFDCVFFVGEYNMMFFSFRIIGKKCDCYIEVILYIGCYIFVVLVIFKGMLLEIL